MFDVLLEWEEAKSVRTAALAASWARIEVRVGTHVATRFLSTRSNSVRSGVYASAFPLARWIVTNWWNLLYERMPAPEVLRGARRGGLASGSTTANRVRSRRSWMERHCLVFSREGMAYPDLSIYREDDAVGIRWVADPEDVPTPGRFLDGGFARLDIRTAETALADVVTAVLGRLEDVEDEETNELRADWRAIQESARSEARLCARLGELGVDPYADDVDPRIEDALENSVLPDRVIADLLAATKPRRLLNDLADLQGFVSSLPSKGRPGKVPAIATSADAEHHLPYRAGYARARALREHLQLSADAPVRDLSTVVNSVVGAYEAASVPTKEKRPIEAVVQRNGTLAVTCEQRSARSQRFLLARALHHWLFVDKTTPTVRLLTRANDWVQAASRSFAAELLAPAAGLAAHLGEDDSAWDATDDLAKEFNVDESVIAHQLANHRLG